VNNYQQEVHHFFVCLLQTLPNNVWGGYCFYLMLAHYDDYLQEYGSLGKFMNQGAEAKHKEGVLAFHRIGGGGIVDCVKKDNIRPDAEFRGLRLRKKLSGGKAGRPCRRSGQSSDAQR
jgi:hypothetical protein